MSASNHRSYVALDAELLLRLQNRTDITAAMRLNFLNDAYLNVSILFRHHELDRGPSGILLPQGFSAVSYFTSISDLWFPTMLRNDTDGYIIRLESKERVERAQTKPVGRPYTYYWNGVGFVFEAAAEAQKQLLLWYKRRPAEISANFGSELDELFDPLIIMDAARVGFETVNEFDKATKQAQLFRNYVTEKKIPYDQGKLNSYRQGWRVRFR